jgi:hypothetical protein
MTLPYRQERLLRRIDRALCRSDPHLASMLSIFARIGADERMPGWEQRRPPPSWGWRVLLWPLASAAFLVVLVAGAGMGAARHAVTACSAASRRCAQQVRNKRAASRAEATLPAADRNRLGT